MQLVIVGLAKPCSLLKPVTLNFLAKSSWTYWTRSPAGVKLVNAGVSSQSVKGTSLTIVSRIRARAADFSLKRVTLTHVVKLLAGLLKFANYQQSSMIDWAAASFRKALPDHERKLVRHWWVLDKLSLQLCWQRCQGLNVFSLEDLERFGEGNSAFNKIW